MASLDDILAELTKLTKLTKKPKLSVCVCAEMLTP